MIIVMFKSTKTVLDWYFFYHHHFVHVVFPVFCQGAEVADRSDETNFLHWWMLCPDTNFHPGTVFLNYGQKMTG